MWFKMSAKLIDSPIAFDLEAPAYAGDNRGCERKLAFVTMLCRAADGCDLVRNPHDLALVARISDRQAAIVWEILAKHGVLRPTDGGYSCAAFLRENALIGEKRAKVGKETGEEKNAFRNVPGATVGAFAGSRTSF